MPLISVIIPAYNSEKTIRSTIASVLNQTFTDYEIIVVNDGSQDSTLDIVSSIEDHRIKIFSYQNSGAPASRNRGFANAMGQFISFLDADDLWAPDKLQAQLIALENNPQADVAYSWTDYITSEGTRSGSGTYVSVNGNVLHKLLVKNFLESGSNPLIRREAIEEVGGFDETLPAVQDWDFYLRLAFHHEFVVVPSPQILYRLSTSSQSISAQVSIVEQAGLKVIERSFMRAPQSLQTLKSHSLANFYRYLMLKTIEGTPSPQKSLKSLHFFRKYIRIDPLWFQNQKTLTLIVAVKALAGILLPSKQAQLLIDRSKRSFRNLKSNVSNISTLIHPRN